MSCSSRRALGVHVALATLVAALFPSLALATSTPAGAAPASSSDALWTPAPARALRSPDGRERRVDPSAYRAYTLDATGLDTLLAKAPDESARGAAPVRIALPAPTGELVDFDVVESPVMEPGLAAAHPEITTYAGRSTDGTGAGVRLDVTPMGLHASVRGAGASWYVDPTYNNDDSSYLSYLGSALPAPQKGLIEPQLDARTLEGLGEEAGAAQAAPGVAEQPGDAVVQRTYRLALVTDQSYARYFGTQNVLAEKVTLMNRVNQIYNDDLGIRMLLIDQTDTLNLDTDAEVLAPNGPCGSAPCFTANSDPAQGCTGPLLTRNRVVLGQLVGASAYDIGHIMLGINGGGVAGLGVVGGNGKAIGCTGLPQPEGDFMAVDYVAHEMGHQFAGNHTFNGTEVNCGGNKAEPSVEPGSGSSVMAYAGICGQDDLQPHSDPYFSQRTLTEVGTYVTAALPPINERQNVALYSFDAGDSFTLTFAGATTAAIVNDATYTLENIKAAIEAILPPGGTVSIDSFANRTNSPLDDEGFQVTFNGPDSPLSRTDVPTLTVTGVSGNVSGFAGEVAKGGPVQNGGFVTSEPGNRTPVVAAPASRTIPIRTPFALTGSASDADGGNAIYLWEQNDQGAGDGTSLVSQTKTNGPIFRIFGKYADVTPAGTLQIGSPGENRADGNPTRIFPDLDQILANNTNAVTGLCPDAPAPPVSGASNVPVPTRECFSEWLPTADYVGEAGAGNTEPSLDFRLTARDLDPTAGGTSYADTKLLIDPTAGPFLVSSKNTPAAAVAGRSEVVAWAVNDTDRPTLAPNVKISLSTDGGHTFPTVLLASTPNDGAEPVTWPDLPTTQARIKIEAVGNYFFDVNNADFQIVGTPVTPGTPGTPGASDTTAPDTSISSGPTEGSIVLSPQAVFGLASTEQPATFRCTFDAAPVACGTSTAVQLSTVGRTHVLTVAAVDATGNVDATPARRTFTVPADDRALKNKKKAWDKKKAGASYRGTYLVARQRGATLQTSVTGATSIALVVGTGKGYGAVKVLLDGKRVGRVSLTGASASQRVLPVITFATPVNGRLTIVTTGAKQVRLDGVAVVTTP
jgi:hypothetical protein